MRQKHREEHPELAAYLVRTERFWESGVRVTEYVYELPEPATVQEPGGQLELIPTGGK